MRIWGRVRALTGHRERGIGSLEYLGMIVLACGLIIGVVLAMPYFPPKIHQVVCEVSSAISGQARDCGGEVQAAPEPEPEEPVPWFADPTLTPEERATRGKHLGGGDSFSSGEGGSAYLPGTDDDNQWKKWWDQHGLWPGEVRQNMCHRSTGAYAQILNSESGFTFTGYDFVACSGAVIDDFYLPNHEVHHVDHPNRQNEGEPPQMSFGDEFTSLITFSIGGNDVGFATVLTECITATALTHFTTSQSGGYPVPPIYCHDSPVAAEATARIQPTADRVRQLLLDLRAQAPNARIIVVGYPKFFPDPPSTETSMIQGPDQVWINSQVEALNAALAQAVLDAGGPEAGFEFVDVGDAFAGCEIGTANSCMNGLRVGLGDNFDSGRPISNGSFHPNDEGHRILAEWIAEQIRTGG